jgi:endoglucanase
VERTTADYQVVGEDAFAALPAAATGELVDGHGGWHDAADYDRNSGHLRVVDDLVDLYELDPALHGADDLGLPESGNGVPDLLDEAAWGLSGWSRLQQADGGVPGGVGTTAYPDLDEMPDADDGVYYAYAADPVASYRFAGAAAKLSRALGDAEWLERALRAWDWAEANPRGYDATVPAVQAAAELLATTGDARWDAIVRERGPVGDPGFVLNDWDGDEWDEALYVYARAAAADPAARAVAVAALDGRAASWVAWAEGSAWRIVKHPYAPVTNGTVTTPVGSGLLIRAWALTGVERYRDAAAWGADVSLGANAAGISWVTGVGDRPVQDPLHTPSLADDVEAPVPGIPLYGPSYVTSGSDNVGVTLAAFDPPIDQWPLLERYADVAYVPMMNEFTVAENVGPAVFAFGALASWTTPPDAVDPTDPTAPGGDDDDDAPAAEPREDAGGCGCGGAAGFSGWLGPALLAGVRRRSQVASDLAARPAMSD